MTDKPQHSSDVSEKPGVPAKPSSGFVGEGGARERDEECPTGRSESEPTLPRRVSRETSELTPEQKMLNDIMNQAMAKSQSRSEESSEPETPHQKKASSPSEEDAPPTPPAKNKPSSAYIYLAVLFGAAFLMLLLAYFVQQRNSAAVQEDLRTTTASREELLENIKALEEERDQLQKKLEFQTSLTTDKYEEAKLLQQCLEETDERLMNKDIICTAQQYFWYIDQFMENREYFMAASAVLFGAEYYRTTWNSQVSINPAQIEQYEAYRQELIDRGYLEERPNPSTLDHLPPTKLYFTQKWDPSQHEDMAALCILWCALEQHFIGERDNGASQYLYRYPLGNPATGYQERVERLASDFTLEQFQLMKDELVEDKWLAIAEDGTMSEGNFMGAKDDMDYNLPFELPEGWENG